MKKLISILFILLFSVVMNAQVTLEPFGVSPRDVEVDSADIFDRAYNGLLNVGVETKVYLKGMGGTTWTLTSKPGSSSSALSSATEVDGAEIVTIIPDLTGTYVVTLDSVSITINAAKYIGNESCGLCHSDMNTKWMETGHATAFTRGLDGEKSDHFANYCVSCHTTGNDPYANNDGFDDFPFVFPDSLYPGQADAVKAMYPDAMKRANITCEACHGPGGSHMGQVADNKMVSSITAASCSYCHDAGTHHVYPDQWKYSGHDATEFDGRGFHGGHAAGAFVGSAGGRNGCSPCHSGAGYVQWVKEGKPADGNGLPTATAFMPEATNISCAVCHDPHSNTNENHQLRFTNTQLGDGTPVTFDLYGYGVQCMECHRSRREAATYSANPANGSSHYGPHHGPQADMLLGANAPDFGVVLPSSPHDAAGGNACVDCHMAGEEHVDSEGNVIKVGGHSFNMNDAEGNDHVEACAPCHGEVGETFKEKKYFKNGVADHDGDGVAEGLQEEVHGLLEILASKLPQTEDGAVDMSAKTNSVAVMKAGYVYYWVEEDRSFGIHNPAFTVALLQTAIGYLDLSELGAGSLLSVADVPNDQGKQVMVSWTQFMGDGVTDNQATSYVVLRMDGEDWTEVGTATPLGMMKYSLVVPTLYDSTADGMMMSKFKVVAKYADGTTMESGEMEGYSIDNLIPMAPTNVSALLVESAVELMWDDPVDEDFEYFAVYRSESEALVPSTENMIGTTVDPMFNDPNVESGKTYYYKVVAYDFSGNMGEASDEVNMSVTGIADLSGLPTEYALFQNYPNPFNPSTQIKFAIPQAGDVKVKVYDAVGKEVATIVNQALSAGYHTFTWNAVNNASGIYFYEIQVNNFTQVNKMLLIK